MKHYFAGILRIIYKHSKKFFIKSPYPYLSKCTEALKGVPLLGNAVFRDFEGKYLENYTLLNLIVWPGRLIEPKSQTN
jgi:hypothetical protein